jgi:hypothetical protein
MSRALGWGAFALWGGLFLGAGATYGQTVWTGGRILFEKPAFSDGTDPANQDQITDNVWLARNITQGLYNSIVESSYDKGTFLRPSDTEWAEGTTADLESLVFGTWFEAVNGAPDVSPGKDYVVHLLSDDIYIDLRMLSWGYSGDANFAYLRSTPDNLPGDFNSDGVVNGRDVLYWQREVVHTDGSSQFAAGTLQEWEAGFGLSNPLISASSVPEPTSFALTMLAASAGLFGRRRGSR